MTQNEAPTDLLDKSLADRQFAKGFRLISRETTVYFAGTLFATAVAFLFQIYLARTLGATAIGVYAIGMSLVGIAQIFVSNGLATAAVRYVPVFTSTKQHQNLRQFFWGAFCLILFSSSLLAIAFILARSWLAAQFFTDFAEEWVVVLFALTVPVSVIDFYLDQTARGFKRVSERTIISSFLHPTIRVALIVALIMLGWGIFGFILGSLLSLIVTAFMLLWLVWRSLPADARSVSLRGIALTPDIRRYVATTTGIGLFSFAGGRLDILILGLFLTTADTGVYKVALSIAAFAVLILTSVNAIFAPVIADLHTQGNYDLLQRLFLTLTKWTLGVTLPIVLVMGFFSTDLMTLFGQEFTAGSLVLIIIVLGQFVNVATGSVGTMLLMTGHQDKELTATIVVGVTSILLMLTLIPLFGLIGAALAQVISLVVSNLIRLYFVHSMLGLFPYNRQSLHLLFPTAAVALFILSVRLAANTILGPVAILLIVLGALIIFSVVSYFLGFNEDDRLLMNQLKRKMGFSYVG